jgi:signal transduction histidine kinase
MMRVSGLPIAAHVALLMVIALVTAFAVNAAVLLALPPRPPDAVRGDRVMNLFHQGYTAAIAGQRLPVTEGARWGFHRSKPVASRAFAERGRGFSHGMARVMGLAPDKVLVSFTPAGRDALVFRVRRNELSILTERTIEHHVITMGRDPPPLAPEAPAANGHVTERTIVMHRDRGLNADSLAPPSAPAIPPLPPDVPLFAPPPPGVALMSGFLIAAELPDGRWLALRQRTSADEWAWLGRAGLGAGVTLVLLMASAWMFARRFARPIQRFATAAERIGVDPNAAPVTPEGPRELRVAAASLNAMQQRLSTLVAERTQMLASVAHDLRTPLMRLRLIAENADQSLREKLAKETAEIDALVSAFIAFARDDPAKEERVRLDLAALLQSLAIDRAEAGDDVTYDGPERVVLTGQALGLKRLFNNLIDNAVKYGTRARIKLTASAQAHVVDVCDCGPGVAPDQREAAFAPFERLGEQRATGAGLGLAAARQIARAHGGDIVIESAPEGGALLRVTLPKTNA